MLDDVESADTSWHEVGGVGDLAFVIFSLTHAGCGEAGVIELRLGERALLGWCPSCAVLQTFGSPWQGAWSNET